MSRAAAWSYTQTATIWPAARDQWASSSSYGAPVQIKCDCKLENLTRGTQPGDEIKRKATFYTEYKDAKKGDLIAIGSHENPPDSAREILDIIINPDTFEGISDDYELVT